MRAVKPKHNCLIVNVCSSSTRTILQACAAHSIHAKVAEDYSTASKLIAKEKYSIIFLSAQLNEEIGICPAWIKLLVEFKNLSPDKAVFITNDQDAATPAINAMKLGADDYLPEPLYKDEIEDLLQKYIPASRTTQGEVIPHITGQYNLIGSSVRIKQTVEIAKKVALTTAPVMISGPNGTGKELIAQLIHNHSKRSHKPYIKINCAAISDSLLQSELFGHEKGAFTNALSRRLGRFERANHGTLLLDEITETSLPFQAQLLRVLEQKTIERVGGEQEIHVDVRIISTTNKNIHEMIADGKFREDLYYRLSTVKIQNPSLTERIHDIPELVQHFVNEFASETPRKINAIDPSFIDILVRYNWPGNIRQLRNAVRSCLILGNGPILTSDDLSWMIEELELELYSSTDKNISLGGLPLIEVEKQAIIATLEQTEGNQSKAAKLLGISGRTLRDKVKKYRDESDSIEQIEKRLAVALNGV